MYCIKCGREVKEGERICECGTEVNLPQIKSSILYEYQSIQVKQGVAPEIIDYYHALGWHLTGQSQPLASNSINLQFKRDRKIKNHLQLNKLQIKLNDSINSIQIIESKKTRSATITSLIIGIVGSLIFGGGLSIALVNEQELLWRYLLGSIVAFVGAVVCSVAYFFYCKIKQKSLLKYDVEIDRKREEIEQIIEEGQKFLTVVKG